MIPLLSHHTNQYLLGGQPHWLLFDTGWPSAMPEFFQQLKQYHVPLHSVSHVLVSHYHPDHCGLIPRLVALGIRLVILGPQLDYIHMADPIFHKDKSIQWQPICADDALLLDQNASRHFLRQFGLGGEIISIPGHSPDSIALMLDNGLAFVGDMPRLDTVDAFNDTTLQESRRHILHFSPRIIYYGHGPAQDLR